MAGFYSAVDIWEYFNRYMYLPRLKNRETLLKSVQSAVGGMLPGLFAYAERWDEASQAYGGLAIEKSSNSLLLQLHMLSISSMCDGGRRVMLPSPSGPIPDECLIQG